MKINLPEKPTIEQAYNAGYNAGRNEPNAHNCNFVYFLTKELAAVHNRGSVDGRKERKRLWDETQ